MYLIDTNVISEIRKRDRADPGVRDFFAEVEAGEIPVFLSVVSIGELRRGIEMLRHRGDVPQARKLEVWLHTILTEYADFLLPLEAETAQVWGRLRVPHAEHALDKQIAATALTHGLTVVTRNEADFAATGVAVRNPFGSSGR
jgi:hypothetical protein